MTSRLQKVVVLVGPGGTGKTELAKAFARWWRDTGGVERPEWVFWHSFEPGVATFGLDGVISEIGLSLYGEQFALLEGGQRRAVVLEALAEHRMLLVWDNFESVRSMPDAGRATPPLDEAGCEELRAFLAAVAAGGQSSVLVTSRTAEDWLGGIRRVRAGGLAAHEAAEYAGLLLAAYPAARRRRAGQAFGDLMQWLDGHPLSMRLVLPRLDSDSPEALLAGLQGTTPLPGHDADAADRTGSLAASVAYSYTHLGPATRRLLSAVSLLHGVADAVVLAAFSQEPQAPERFAGAGRDEWASALNDAARVGLLTGLGTGLYQIHPALPGYLAAAWQAEEPGYPAVREAAINALLAAHAAFGEWLLGQIGTGDAGFAFTVIGLERRTLGSLLSHALDHGLWQEAQAILQPLDEFWDARGLDAEAGAWADRIRSATEVPASAPPRLDTSAGALWLFTAGSQANRELLRRHLDRAEDVYRQVMSALQAMDASSQQQGRIAVTYHQLGAVAQARGDLGMAEDWYQKALAIEEELGDRPGLVSSYHQLGAVAQDRGDLGTAEDWYQKALAIEEELGDRPRIAMTYHQLGRVAQDRGDLGMAEDWYQKALAIQDELGDRPSLASTYHNLGRVAQDRGDLGTAQDWYQKSLAIKEELGNRPDMP